MQSVVDVLVGQIKRHDFAAVGVDANMEFAPRTGVVQKWPVLGNTDDKNPAARQGWF